MARSATRKQKEKEKRLQRKRVLQILTGSIAAYRGADIIRDLRDEGAEVTCILTSGAKRFITPLTIRAVSGHPVYDDMFAADTSHDVLHTELAEQADLILVAPASASFLARAAAGFADDLASCVVLAAASPVLIAPAMNDLMYENFLTQRNLKTLREAGYRFVEPVEGHLVCGREAVGHIAEPRAIVDAVVSILR